MENRAHALAAGLFTLLLGIGVVVAAQWFSRDNYEKVRYTLESKYSVSGLNLQAAVRLRGVEVGKVESIEFDPEDPGKILIRITVRGGTRVTRGTVAQLETQGITGLAYVVLNDDGSNKTLLPPSDDKDKRIAVKKSFLDELTGSGKDLIGQFGEVAQRITSLLDDKNQAQFTGTLAALETAAQRAGELAQSLESSVRNVPALTADARKLMAGAELAMREVAPLLQDAKTTLAGIDKLTHEYVQRADALERVAKSAEQIGSATVGAAATVTTSANDLVPRINMLLEELSRNSRSLDRLLSELNEQPQGLVFGRPSGKPGPGETGHADTVNK